MSRRTNKLSAFDSTVEVWRDAANRARTAFLEAWPIERLPEMTLDDYAMGFGRESFCWWLEIGTHDVGSISTFATQYGVYWALKVKQYMSMRGVPEPNPEKAFEAIRDLIVRAAHAAREKDLETLAALEAEAKNKVSPVILRKVAVLYQPEDGLYLLPVCAFHTVLKTLYGSGLRSWKEAQERFFEYKPEADYWQRAYEVTQPLRDADLAAMKPQEEESTEEDGGTADPTDAAVEEPADDGRYAEVLDLLRRRKNVILQGAPGTGKTYAVPEIVTRLCGVAPKSGDRADVMKAWMRLLDERRVDVVTFHPSLDYEDFVEGWRPVSNKDDGDGEKPEASVELVDGIFKEICATASALSGPADRLRDGANVWKVTLGRAGANPVRKDCFKNGRIRIGWDEYGEDPAEAIEKTLPGSRSLEFFQNGMRPGDVVVSCWSETETDAVGIVTGGPEWLPDDGLGCRRSRRVDWLWAGRPEVITHLNDDIKLKGDTVYLLDRVPLRDLRAFLAKHGVGGSSAGRACVLVIDEINRGNISTIFGELITLIEPDKRAGGASQTTVKLAYSKKAFTIPENLYILGTMNTADRSLGAIDYALRRRFGFHRLRPQVLDDERFDKDLFLAVSALFVKNPEAAPEERVEPNTDTMTDAFEPEDVWPGHSYFLMEDDDARSFRWHHEIRPLLMEYVRDGVLKKSALERIDSIESEFAL